MAKDQINDKEVLLIETDVQDKADKFQVYIMGHSCGLSDRTMLNTIFENPNCLSIKIFYHNGIEGYTNTAQEISRHFKDKKSMREKIVPFPYCIPMPEV